MPLTEKMDIRVVEMLKRLEKVETDLKLLQDWVRADEILVFTLIESISTMEFVNQKGTVTNLFYEVLDDAVDRQGLNRGPATLARTIADRLNAKNNVTSKRRRSKKP